ncbi:MAG: ABC transporter permease [Planctomycetota bacterium]|jgi:ribose transport system permease protein|nr:ABC transporter permease [Planctomycetota bacterium]
MPFFRRFGSILGSLVGFFLLCAIFSYLSPYFLTLDNFISVLRQGAALYLVAIAMTFCIISGGIDLSVGSVMALAGCSAGIFMSNGLDWRLACLLGLVEGLILGCVMGLLVARLQLQPFIVTLVVMSFARGLALVFTNGQPVSGFPREFRWLGTAAVPWLDFLPVPVFIGLVSFILAAFVLRETNFGINIYAIGSNYEAALYSGINVKRTLTLVYTLSGLLSAAGGIILTSRVNSGQPILGEGIELDGIAAVVIGGTAMSGGQGGILGTVIGTMIILYLRNGLNLMAVSAFWQKVVIGIVILVAVLVDKYQQSLRARRSAMAMGE